MSWREIKTVDMQSNKLQFYDAKDALRTYMELHTTMNTARGYDYSEAVVADTTGQTFGLDEYITLKHTFQIAARDVGYDLWVIYLEHEINGKSIRSLSENDDQSRKKLAIVKRAVESELRKRNMLKVKQ
jgi:hypothetical protein